MVFSRSLLTVVSYNRPLSRLRHLRQPQEVCENQTSKCIYLFIYMIGVLRRNQGCITYTTAASIVVGGIRAVPGGTLQPAV